MNDEKALQLEDLVHLYVLITCRCRSVQVSGLFYIPR